MHFVVLASFLSIMRLKSKHHERSMVPKLWQPWFLMMPTFRLHDAKMMHKKT